VAAAAASVLRRRLVRYASSSPDEEALVHGAAELGVALAQRTRLVAEVQRVSVVVDPDRVRRQEDCDGGPGSSAAINRNVTDDDWGSSTATSHASTGISAPTVLGSSLGASSSPSRDGETSGGTSNDLTQEGVPSAPEERRALLSTGSGRCFKQWCRCGYSYPLTSSA